MEDQDYIDVMYNMEMFGVLHFKGYVITRVPGGWMFSTPRGIAFVPYNEEGKR